MNKKLLYTIILISISTTSSLAQISGLLQKFPFNNIYSSTTQNQTTVSFNSNAGTSFVQDRNGNATSALQINNTGTTALIPNLPGGSSERTVALWVKINSFNAQSFNFLFNYGTTGTNAYGAVLNQTSITNFGSPTAPTSHTQPITNTLNTWDHFVFTFENPTNNTSYSKIYKNGVLIGVKQLFVNTLNPNAGFRLGLTEAGNPNYFSGVVDDLEIYNRALTANEVYQLYGSNATPTVAWNFTGVYTSTSGLYPFSTPSGAGLNNNRANQSNSALFINNSGSVATGVTPLPSGNAARTISFWFKRSQSDLQELFVYGSSGHASCFGLYVTANGNFVNYYTNNGTTYAAMSGSSNQPIAPDTWHFISVVYSQDSSIIYRNGVSIAAFSNTVTLTTNGTNFLLGKVLTSSSNPFQGTIDDIKVYQGALSSAEIAAHYASESTLPTYLNNFKAQLKNQTAYLNWQSSTEINTSHFDVEYSNNATTFEKVKTVQAIGNSSIPNFYEASYAVSNEATHYFRLKMIDKDGKFTYSNIIKLHSNKFVTDFSIIAMPNISTGRYNINVNHKSKENITLQVLNLQGIIVNKQQIQTVNGTTSININLDNQPSGIYFIQAITNNRVVSERVIKN